MIVKKPKVTLHIVTKIQFADGNEAHKFETAIPGNSPKTTGWNDARIGPWVITQFNGKM